MLHTKKHKNFFWILSNSKRPKGLLDCRVNQWEWRNYSSWHTIYNYL